MANLLYRYGTRALWSLPPSRQLDIKRRTAQLKEIYGSNPQEPTRSSPDNVSTTPRPSFPLVASIEDPERICMDLQKRIAEYAREISNYPGLAYENREIDATIKRVIGDPQSFQAISIADILQAHIGAYIYDNILLSKDSHDRLDGQPWERNLHVWLQNSFHPNLPAEYAILRLVMDTALSFKALVDNLQLELSWPLSGSDFDEESMVSWSRDVPRGSTVLLALTFTVSRRNGREADDEGTDDEGTDDEGTDDEGTNDEGTDDEGTDDEGTDDEGTDDEGTDDEGTNDEGTDDEGTDDEGTEDEGTEDEGTDDEGTDGGTGYQVLYPSTVVLQNERKLAKADQADEIERLRHMLISNRRIWLAIQSSALLMDRDWCGYRVKENRAGEADESERRTKKRRL